MAIPGEETCFLVVLEGWGEPAELTVTAEGAEVSGIWPSAVLEPGTVGEACVTIDPSNTESTANVEIAAFSDGRFRTERRTIGVMPMEDDREAVARPYLERWVAWLEENHPELGITTETDWEGRYVQAVLIVGHYAYWSDEWEMVVSWHVMVPPDDFTEVFLRRRLTETGYSAAFRQDSFAEESEPRPIKPRDLIR